MNSAAWTILLPACYITSEGKHPGSVRPGVQTEHSWAYPAGRAGATEEGEGPRHTRLHASSSEWHIHTSKSRALCIQLGEFMGEIPRQGCEMCHGQRGATTPTKHLCKRPTTIWCLKIQDLIMQPGNRCNCENPIRCISWHVGFASVTSSVSVQSKGLEDVHFGGRFYIVYLSICVILEKQYIHEHQI